jgi:hypothetical protein
MAVSAAAEAAVEKLEYMLLAFQKERPWEVDRGGQLHFEDAGFGAVVKPGIRGHLNHEHGGSARLK